MNKDRLIYAFPLPPSPQKTNNLNKLPPPPTTTTNFNIQEGVNQRNPSSGPGFGLQLCFSCWTQGGSLALHLAAPLRSCPLRALRLSPWISVLLMCSFLSLIQSQGFKYHLYLDASQMYILAWNLLVSPRFSSCFCGLRGISDFTFPELSASFCRLAQLSRW